MVQILNGGLKTGQKMSALLPKMSGIQVVWLDYLKIGQKSVWKVRCSVFRWLLYLKKISTQFWITLTRHIQTYLDDASWWLDVCRAKALTSSSGPRKQRYSSSIRVNSWANTAELISNWRRSKFDPTTDGANVEGENCANFSTWNNIVNI